MRDSGAAVLGSTSVGPGESGGRQMGGEDAKGTVDEKKGEVRIPNAVWDTLTPRDYSSFIPNSSASEHPVFSLNSRNPIGESSPSWGVDRLLSPRRLF